uniref:Putative Alkaline-phosphatase-like family protein n=1 Tax=Davidia involucrata TaxID=16924 RepID=A0A5B7BMG7_DAVIN
MSSLTCTKLTLCTIAAVLIQIIGLLLFVLGFFPVKPALSGVSGPESFRSPVCNSVEDRNVTILPPDQLKLLYQELSEVPPSFDRLILMVIDGLPAEFVLGKDGQPPSRALMEAMPYTQSLLANGMAIGYHAKAAPPTVTMPRLKAMLSGAIGGFLDVAFNFNTQALLDDNLIGQFFGIGWKMVMLGDETWLKLFPGLFTRHDGVSSFYVKDTIQVDHNVSRHLGDELNRTDWNLQILHYLGLDHVGHIGGRNSVLMGPKLNEMDEVVKMIHLSAIQSQDNDQGQTLLMIVSDHGMTDNGNHGGSSYAETDTLALFIGLRTYVNDYATGTHRTVYQVDIVPTLALLFGVPIPKNNVGVLIAETFDSLTDYQRLRALELNSWQLLRLLQTQLPGLSCGSFSCDVFRDDQGSGISDCNGSVEEMFCCLYLNAAALHQSWKSKKVSRSNSRDDYGSTVLAYQHFLRPASEWLSGRATDKPVGLLASGITAMLLSCLALLGLLLEVYLREKHELSDIKINMHKWNLDETFILAIIFILVLSIGSSSMVEEEQYIWHFVTSTFYLVLLRKTIQSFTAGTAQSSPSVTKGQRKRICIQLCSIIVILISGRILRGWHQGGVNWTHLPDISKWLQQAGSDHVKSIQLVSGLLVISLGLCAVSLLQSNRKFAMVVGFIFLIPGLLVLQHIMKYQESALAASGYGATLMAQVIYAILGIFTIGIVIALPWLMPVKNSKTSSHHFCLSTNDLTYIQTKFLLEGFRDSTYLIGWVYIFCWCLLQLLLQQQINSMPILLILVQILASMSYSSNSDLQHKQWVEVAALYYLGMAGHFGLGNTNTLATIDVAGAFIGLSSHSTILSGILMFIITYASPMLALLSMVMYISMKNTRSLVYPQGADFGHLLKMTVGSPCLVPLGLNSVFLVAYTVMLLLMRNHLFVWSVFSPKYMYVGATTICIYLGVFVVASTGIYTFLVFALRRMVQGFNRNDLRASMRRQ